MMQLDDDPEVLLIAGPTIVMFLISPHNIFTCYDRVNTISNTVPPTAAAMNIGDVRNLNPPYAVLATCRAPPNIDPTRPPTPLKIPPTADPTPDVILLTPLPIPPNMPPPPKPTADPMPDIPRRRKLMSYCFVCIRPKSNFVLGSNYNALTEIK